MAKRAPADNLYAFLIRSYLERYDEIKIRSTQKAAEGGTLRDIYWKVPTQGTHAMILTYIHMPAQRARLG